jgi:branched-chain amino acid transport system ATP-binding protein
MISIWVGHMLSVRNLNAYYGSAQVLWDVSLDVGAGEIVAVMGPNGSGKSTILKAIVGLLPHHTGIMMFCGRDLASVPAHARVELGISFVLERRRLFPMMTVAENLKMGAYTQRDRKAVRRRLDWVESLFPILATRRDQLAGRMSGGEQQIVAIARGLMSAPKLLLLDEPFLGLAPQVVDQVVDLIKLVNREGIAIMFNEQNVHLSFGNADRGYLLESGRVMLQGSGLEMLAHDVVRRVYLGEGASA